ncbi:MAG: GNAT family N-acetyltransferase [Hyphomicrobiaceae bacterium]
MSTTIRTMTPDDFETLVDLKWALNKIERESMPDTHTQKGDRSGARQAAREGIRGYMEITAERTGEILIAEHDGSIAGCIVWYPDMASPSLHDEARPRAQISGFIVRPEYRGSGIGKALMTEVETRARKRGLQRMSLNVVDWNEPARALYERIGFEPMELIMTRRLD